MASSQWHCVYSSYPLANRRAASALSGATWPLRPRISYTCNGLPHNRVINPPLGAQVSDHHRTGVHPHPHPEELPTSLLRPPPSEFAQLPPLLPALAQLRHLLLHVDAGQHRTLRVILAVH